MCVCVCVGGGGGGGGVRNADNINNLSSDELAPGLIKVTLELHFVIYCSLRFNLHHCLGIVSR